MSFVKFLSIDTKIGASGAKNAEFLQEILNLWFYWKKGSRKLDHASTGCRKNWTIMPQLGFSELQKREKKGL